jgi:hypothetical protein
MVMLDVLSNQAINGQNQGNTDPPQKILLALFFSIPTRLKFEPEF